MPSTYVDKTEPKVEGLLLFFRKQLIKFILVKLLDKFEFVQCGPKSFKITFGHPTATTLNKDKLLLDNEIELGTDDWQNCKSNPCFPESIIKMQAYLLEKSKNEVLSQDVRDAHVISNMATMKFLSTFHLNKEGDSIPMVFATRLNNVDFIWVSFEDKANPSDMDKKRAFVGPYFENYVSNEPKKVCYLKGFK